MEIIDILKIHTSVYPEMQPQDAVKLIYQNEFGGGHLIKEKEAALKRIYSEYESLEKDFSEEKFEDIGNNIVRVNLKALKSEELPLLSQAFFLSSSLHKGSLLAFKYKLRLLWENFDLIGFNFIREELKNYLISYKNAGYPMVSHSKIYNEHYNPAYRIIMADFVNTDLVNEL